MKAFTDIRFDVVQKMPEKARPYALLMRLDRPIGIWLLFLPCLWAVLFAVSGIANLGFEQIWYILLFLIGAIIMRGAGCIINDLWDRDIDPQVARTKQRPLASGIISLKEASIFLGILLLIGLIILLQLPGLSIIIGLFSVLLVIAYPTMKRFTYWPQAFLGITFNIGILIGWSAVTGIIEMPASLLYAAGFFWTLGYDTIYAYQDIDDDVKIGVKSTALKFGKFGKWWVKGFYTAMALLIIYAAHIAHANIFFFIALLPAIAYGIKLVIDWDMEDQESSLLAFKNNMRLGLLIVLAFCFA